MVTKKRKASRPKTRTVYRTAPRKTYRRKSGIADIPGAAATVALAASMAPGIKAAYDYATTASTKGFAAGVKNYIMAPTAGAQRARAQLIGKDALVKDAIAICGGYLAGECIREYAPKVIKRPAAKIAKKLPKVI